MQHPGNLGDQEIKGIPHENQLRLVGHIAACSSIMDDSSGSRSNLADGMDVLSVEYRQYRR